MYSESINSRVLHLLLFISILFPEFSKAQTGPGGVGNSTSNILWLNADSITGLSDNNPVSTWADKSGNSKDLTQGTAADQPTYQTNEINGKPTVRFDGVDDYLIRNPYTGFASSTITTFIVNKNNGEVNDGILSYATTASDNDFELFNSSNMEIDRGGLVNTGTSVNDNNFHIGASRWNSTWGDTRYHKDGTQTYSGTLSAWTSITSGGSLVLAQEQDNVGGGLDPAQAHTGDYAEVILYNTFLNDAQMIILQNYLAAKYQISMASNDYYSYETTNGNEVAGIGRTDWQNTHTDAESANIFEISNPSGLGDGDFLLFGHDNASISSWNNTEIPGGDVTNARRISREWRLSETGNVGTIRITMDATRLPSAPAGFTQYGFWTDSDGDFSTGAVWHPLTSIGGNKYRATGISTSNGDFVTFGVICPKIQFTLNADNAFEPALSKNIQISLNYSLSGNATVNYAVTGGTATGGGVDYTLANGTATVTAGNTTTNITISIVNDVIVESDETVIITLSGPSAGVGLNTNTTHTFTIHDDDNSRKIDFALASSNGAESVTPVTLTIQINNVDNTNPTTVDYNVSGGTATGGGTDYTLTSGTATITPTQTTTTISFTVNDDALDEPNETILITLSNPTNSNIGTNITHTYTINDNDSPPTVQFNAISSSGAESVSPVSFQVNLSSASGKNVTVDYAISGGTATGGGVDYTFTNGTLTILAGATSVTITSTIIDDAIEELDETFTLALSNPVNATLGANTNHTYTILNNDYFGYTGPGGVGHTSNNVLWLRADSITGLSNGNDVTSWTDKSGNNNTISQSNTTYTPRYYSNVVNGKPVVRWEQADTRIRKTSFNNFPSTAITSIFVNKNGDSGDGLISYASTTSDNDYEIFGSNNLEMDKGATWIQSGTPINNNAWNIVTNTWISNIGNWYFYLNGTYTFSTNMGSGTSFTSGGCLAIGSEQDAMDGGYAAGQSHNGDFSEVILYNTVLNTAQRTIVENYLSSKYGIAISNDKYAYDATHGYEVAGIGREDANDLHPDAKGPGIVRINTPSSLDDGDYMLWGHDNASLANPNKTDVPTGIDNRMNRVWRVDKTNDVGSVSVSFDLTGFSVSSGSDLELLIDADGVFSNATRYIGGRTWNPPIVTFTGVNFTDGDYFTIASASPSTVLPVELTSFKANCDKEKVHIHWTTATETNNNFFTLERNSEGLHWKTIDTLAGAGNSTTLKNYSFTDNPFEISNAGNTVYYRLKQTDYNGKYKYSHIITANCQDTKLEEIKIIPNPNNGDFTIQGTAGFTNLSILNSYGAVVFTSAIESDFRKIDMKNYPEGIYFLLLKSNQGVVTKKIVVSR